MKRTLYKPLGFTCLLLGGAGIVLPILPSTPFVLLAAWFFARSSEKWHQHLLASELFGPMIRNWETRRCISARTKLVALGTMLLAGSSSIAFAISDPTLKMVTAALLAVGTAVVLLIPTCSADCQKPETRAGDETG